MAPRATPEKSEDHVAGDEVMPKAQAVATHLEVEAEAKVRHAEAAHTTAAVSQLSAGCQTGVERLSAL